MPQRTVICKMRPTAIHIEALKTTLDRYAGACDAVLDVSRREKTSNKVKLQHLIYHDIRKQFGLSANLAVRAIARVCWAVKAAKRANRAVKTFKPTSIDYDERIFAYRENEEAVSLTTVNGRIHVPLALGQYQREALRGKKPTAAKLVYRSRAWHIHIVIEDDPGQRSHPICAIGVDRGIYNIAVTSTGKFHGGRRSLHERKKALALRARLQRKGTRSATRALHRLSGKESRRARDRNHVVSKAIVQEAKAAGCAIAIEDLKGIRSRRGLKHQSGKPSRSLLNAWPFRQLGDFLRYKAERAGVQVVEVPAGHSSHTCPRCDATGDAVVRRGPHFVCGVCGYRAAADLAAACVIASRGRHALGLARADVMRPSVSDDHGQRPAPETSLRL